MKSTGSTGLRAVKNNKGRKPIEVETPKPDSDAHHCRAKELSKNVLQEPDVDNEKLSRIKAAIENGTYEVNPEAIAEKLLAEVDGIDFQDYDQSQGEE